MLENVLWIVVGLVGLYFGGNWLVKGAARLANTLGVSPIVIGLTIVAYGTSIPELIVSLRAAIEGNADISTGNVVGSNIANIGLILGLSAIIFPMVVQNQFLRREMPIMIGVSVLLLFLSQNGVLDRTAGILLVIGAVSYTLVAYVLAKREGAALIPEIEEFEEAEGLKTKSPIPIDLLYIIGGIAVLMVGADRLVFGAVNIARAVGVSELAIGITLVAVGTSLPELATSLIAAFKKESDIAIGNVVGSNIFNILAILGITSIITPINVNPQLLRVDMFVMIGFAILLTVFCIEHKLARWEGALLLVAYLAFVIYAFSVTPPVPNGLAP